MHFKLVKLTYLKSPDTCISCCQVYCFIWTYLFVLDVVFWNLVSIFLKHQLYTWFVWYCQFCTGWKYSTYLVKNKVLDTCTLTFWNPGSGILHLGIHRLSSLGYLWFSHYSVLWQLASLQNKGKGKRFFFPLSALFIHFFFPLETQQELNWC